LSQPDDSPTADVDRREQLERCRCAHRFTVVACYYANTLAR
jgi:hypothetical protein